MTPALHRRRRTMWTVSRLSAGTAWINDEEFEILETGILADEIPEPGRPVERCIR